MRLTEELFLIPVKAFASQKNIFWHIANLIIFRN